MSISLKRAYEDPSPSDGCRILTERLWPRGVLKDRARIDLWAKDVAPSTELRRWYDHDPEKWQEFRSRYLKQLGANLEAVAPILERVREGHVTFVYASRETRLNSSVLLKEFIEAEL